MNSGYLPVVAVLFSAEIGESLAKRSVPLFHGSNGHPACCAAALATIGLMQRRGLVDRAAQYGVYFRERLQESLKLSVVKEIRAIGLMLGVVLAQEDGTPATPAQLYEVSNALKKMGVLAYMGLSTLVFCPAFVIMQEEIDVVVEQLVTVLSAMRLQNGSVEIVN
jgi:adenosylmethionine-8-amino-7-oxononanoate aminotransferase